MSKQPNSKQKQWIKDVAEWAINGGMSELYGTEWQAPFHIHHVLGRTARHNKVAIGHWFLLPVPIVMHEPNLNHEFHVGKCKKAFIKRFDKQSKLFDTMCESMVLNKYYILPFSALVEDAIRDTNA